MVYVMILTGHGFRLLYQGLLLHYGNELCARSLSFLTQPPITVHLYLLSDLGQIPVLKRNGNGVMSETLIVSIKDDQTVRGMSILEVADGVALLHTVTMV